LKDEANALRVLPIHSTHQSHTQSNFSVFLRFTEKPDFHK